MFYLIHKSKQKFLLQIKINFKKLTCPTLLIKPLCLLWLWKSKCLCKEPPWPPYTHFASVLLAVLPLSQSTLKVWWPREEVKSLPQSYDSCSIDWLLVPSSARGQELTCSPLPRSARQCCCWIQRIKGQQECSGKVSMVKGGVFVATVNLLCIGKVTESPWCLHLFFLKSFTCLCIYFLYTTFNIMIGIILSVFLFIVFVLFFNEISF